VVIRTDAIRARLLRLEEVVAKLVELRALPPAEIDQDFRNAWALERGLQIGAEVLLDVGDHVLSARFGASAADYEDILGQLGRRGVIDGDLAARLRGLGGFRNILVRGYLDLDPAQVREHLSHAPEDFDAFARALRAWLTAQGLDG
jgi:uncharacterized protein YutE (UPF0331/DUF86 family)